MSLYPHMGWEPEVVVQMTGKHSVFVGLLFVHKKCIYETYETYFHFASKLLNY